MIPAALAPYKAWLVAGVVVVLVGGGFAAGWAVQGWRKGAEVSKVQAARSEEHSTAAVAVASSAQAARAKEAAAGETQTKATDDLSTAKSSNASRAGDLYRRLRERAATRPSCPNLPQGASAPGPGDGDPAAGLPDVARADLVRLAESANNTADTLRQCRVLLHSAWQITQ